MLVRTETTEARVRPNAIRERTRFDEGRALAEAARADEASVGEIVAHDLDAAAAQIGHALHIRDVQRRLQGICRNIHFEVARADPELMGVYLIREQGWNSTDPGETRMFIGRIHRGPWVPEFQVYKSKFIDRPDPQIRGHTQRVRSVDDMLWGWRTMLARLIRLGAISPTAAEKAFDMPSRSSENWQVLTT